MYRKVLLSCREFQIFADIRRNSSPPPLFFWKADKHRGSGRGGVAQTPHPTPPLTPPLRALISVSKSYIRLSVAFFSFTHQ